ncbi:MAG: cellulose binding domain-containing protein, partial [Lachnospiraceae bacterium]|nr:cellulose binding domain-containing protein [Lachnospiraceae bacterium]
MHKSRFLSLLLCVCLVISSIPAIKTDAKSADSIIYQQDGIEIYYGVDSSWSGAFNAHITIKNRSQKDVENWGLQFEFSNKISNIWNGKILSNENQTYTVKNAGYNQDLKKGSEVTIGFSANGDAKVLPDNIALCSEEFVVEDGYSTKLVVNSDWGSGFSGAIELSNTGKEAIEDWTIEFDFNRDIDTIWNGVIVKREGSHYVIKNADYNQKILPGQSVSIGFNGHKGNVKTETINNVKLSSFGSVSTTPKVVDGRVKIDTSMLIPDEENIFFMPKDVYSIIGTVENSSNVKKLTYSSNNTFGLDLLSGELTIGDNWAIENIPLILGYNELTVTALYKDNTVSSDTIIIAYMYDDRMDGFDNLVIDSDSDGLEDYIEAIYGTDPLKKDTDEDGLSDYTELVVMGTDPLKADTDGNGILDGNEDYDKDGLSNKEEEELGTLLYGVDSDYDDLTDYDEVHKYNTNPVLADTDGDGASDGFEVANGYDPLTAETSFKVEKTVDVGGTTYELLLTADGENIESLEVIPVNNSGAKYGLIPGYLDAAVDFRINGTFESAKLKVYFDESYLEIEGFVPALYYIDEENHEMVEIPGEWDGVSNYFYVDVPHFSTYITLNKTEFIRVWENAIKAHAITQDGKTNLNIVFVTDLSGSMRGSKITTMKSSINAFIDVLSPSDKAAVVSFTSSATVLSGLTSDKTVLKQIVSSMSVGGMTAIYTGLDKAVEILENPDVSGYKMIIVFTDGYDEPSTTYDGQYKSIVERALKADISIQTIGIGTIDSALLTKVAQNTGGSFYYAENASALTSQVTQVQEDIIDYTKDSNNDGISDYFTKLLCDGKLITWRGEPILIGATYEEVQNDSDGDLDNDGIKNGEELILQTNEDKVVNI